MICKAPSARLRGGEGVAVIGEGRGKGRAAAQLPGLVIIFWPRESGPPGALCTHPQSLLPVLDGTLPNAGPPAAGPAPAPAPHVAGTSRLPSASPPPHPPHTPASGWSDSLLHAPGKASSLSLFPPPYTSHPPSFFLGFSIIPDPSTLLCIFQRCHTLPRPLPLPVDLTCYF